MSCFVVVNPSAGGGRTGRQWPAIAKEISSRIGPFDHALTNRAGDATSMVRAAIETGASLIIAVGGDGTINEAVNGFAGADGTIAPGCAFAALARGTGADFVRSLSTPADDPLARIASGQTRQIDLGQVTYTADNGDTASRLFINIASIGLSGEVDRAVNAERRTSFLPGFAAYYLATLSALWRYRFADIQLAVDNQPPITINLAMAAIANGRYFGGGMQVAPQARLDSGEFEIIVLRGGSKLTLLKDLSLVYRGAHMDHPMITALRGRRVTAEPVDPDQHIPLDIDGESPGHLKAVFDILPSALTLRQ
jgi:YegS/Rv2252/BmrU family lipid kinase